MSLHAEPRNKIDGPEFRQNTLKNYIPPKVVDRIPGIKTNPNFIQAGEREPSFETMFAESEIEMRRYGSVQELSRNLEAFSNFTGAHVALEANRWEPLISDPVVYKSLRHKLYLNKQDVVVHLQNMILEKLPIDEHFPVFVLAAYLKFHEEKLASCFEFVHINDERFTSIADYIDENVSLTISGDQRGSSGSAELTFQNIVTWVTKLIPDWNESHWGIYVAVRNMCKANPPEVFPDLYRRILHDVETVIDACQVIINARPTIFQPDSYTPDVNHPVVLRLFEDGPRRFVMREELNRVVPVESGGKRLLTIDVREALRLIAGRPDQSVQVELLITPIIRTKHCALLIRTPSSGHCKMAGDTFLELLQDFIFGTMIFQKLKHTEWPIIIAVFRFLQRFFIAELKDVYFIEAPGNGNTIIWPSDANEIIARPAKHVRNAKADGFTVQNLKNELKHLGLTEAFPDIIDYAEVVYEHVSKVKKEPVLRTCDLFDAVEQCQLICLLKKIPVLSRFLHNQNCCNRVLITDCCSKKVRNGPRFAESQWKTIPLKDVELENLLDDVGEFKGITDKKLVCPNRPHLYYNDSSMHILLDRVYAREPIEKQNEMAEKFISTGPRKVFYVDRKEFDTIGNSLTYSDFASQLESLKSLQEYVKQHKKMTIYLRTIAWSPINRENERQVFVEELKDMLPVLLEIQGDSVDYDKIEAYWKEHFAQEPPCPEMMKLDKLERVLKDFDINQAKITLVPDIVYASAIMNQVPTSSGNRIITIFGPNREPLVHKHQVIFKIFQDVVCDVDWSRKDGVKNELCEQILQKMKQFLNGSQELFDPKCVDECVSRLKKTRGYLEQKKKKLLTPLIKLFDCDFNDTISISFFLSECKQFGISYQSTASRRQLNETVIPAWKARLLFLVEWNKMFIGGKLEHEELWRVIQTGIYHRTPLLQWESEDDFLDVILYKTKNNAEYAKMQETRTVSDFKAVSNHEWLENTSWRDRSYINRFKKWEVREMICPPGSCSEDLVVLIVPTKLAAFKLRSEMESQRETLDDVERRSLELLTRILRKEKKPMEFKTDPKKVEEVECLQEKKKSRSPIPLQELAEAASSQAKEEPPKLVGTRDKKENETNRESANCEKCFRTSNMCKQAKEDAAGLQRQVEKLKKGSAAAEKKFNEREELEKRRQLEEERKTRETVTALTDEISALKLKLAEHEEASESAKRANGQLQCEKSELDVSNSEKDRIIRLLKVQIPKETLRTLEIEKTAEMKRVFVDLKEKWNELKSSSSLGNAQKQMHTFISMNDDPMVRQRVEFEMLQFRVDFQKYSTAIEQNIEKIAEDALITREELIPLPDLPALSEVILEEFRKAQDAKNQQIDKECVICFTGFKRKAKKAYRCSGCKKNFHVDCVKDWWKRKEESRECPHCNVQIDADNEIFK